MKKIITCILTLVLLVTPIVSLAAAPAAASFLEGPANVELGKEFEVTYYLQGDEVRAANGLVSFNTSRLEVVSASLDVSGWILESENVDDGLLFVVANENGDTVISEKTAVFTITFIASRDKGLEKLAVKEQNVANGKADAVALADTAYASESEKEEEKPVESAPTTSTPESGNQGGTTNQGGSGNQGGVNVTPPKAEGPSADFTLKSLSVKGQKLLQKDTNKEGFDAEVKNYVLTVPFSVEKLDVEFAANDDKATVEVTDTELKYVGTNITKIVVTAENGSKRTYKIYTTRLAPEKDDANQSGAEQGINWMLIAIIGGGVLLLAIIVLIIILLAKKKN